MTTRVRLSGHQSQQRAPAIDTALRDSRLLGAALGDPASWETWLAVLRASRGLPLDERQREIFASVAGGRAPPTQPVKEFWVIAGRRSGKSRMAGALAVDVACLQQHRLAPGEVGYVLVLSPTLAQSNVVFGAARGFIEESPMLRDRLLEATRSELRLRGNVVIGTHPSSFRSIRGRTLLAVVLDESALFRDETSANPDIEVYRAVKPALIASGGVLIGISSPYRKSGLLFNRHKDFFGVEDPEVLVVQGRSVIFNPTLSEKAIAKALADDPEGNLSEWNAEFRADISAFLSDDDVDAAVDYDRPLELPPRKGIVYRAFSDPSGGRGDHFCIGIGHVEGQRVVIDVVRGAAPPFDPAQVVGEHAALLREYGLNQICGDNYSAEWVATAYKESGIRYTRCELPKGRLYIENLPAFTRRIVSMPDHPRLVRELRLLERRTHIGGKDTVDHGRTGSDDYANAVVGVLHHCLHKRQQLRMGTYDFNGPPGCEIDPVTGRPVDLREHTRIRWVTIPESSAPAVKGPY